MTRRRILVIDRDAAALADFVRLFGARADVSCVRSPQRGAILARSGGFDVVLIDEGFAEAALVALRTVGAHQPSAVKLLVTTDDDDDALPRAELEAAASARVKKPWDPSELARWIEIEETC